MITLLYGVLRYSLFSIAFAVFYMLEGGHLHVVMQPFEIGMQIVFCILCVFFYCGTIDPVDEKQRTRFHEAGRAAFVMNLIIPTTAGLIHGTGFLTANPDVIGEIIGASLAAVINAPLLYFSFFKWADPKIGQQTPALITKPLRVPVTKSPRANKVLYGYYCVSMVCGAVFLILTIATVVILIGVASNHNR